ncbi:MAG: hypothetical protein RSA29_02685 [Clostridium sp.]|uniref:hypothetical protein n=1 Tax=Clostridium sp. TaxID=1506 RepID=UPI0030366F2F
MGDSYCEVCGNSRVELHHIVFRGQASYMRNVKINFKYLCQEHHRGNESPHMNSDIDFKYKYELQKELFKLFDKEFYSEDEIKELLGISYKDVIQITKKLRVYSEGYEKLDICIRLMGGRLYAK